LTDLLTGSLPEHGHGSTKSAVDTVARTVAQHLTDLARFIEAESAAWSNVITERNIKLS
jgi:hypothetical protein